MGIVKIRTLPKNTGYDRLNTFYFYFVSLGKCLE